MPHRLAVAVDVLLLLLICLHCVGLNFPVLHTDWLLEEREGNSQKLQV